MKVLILSHNSLSRATNMGKTLLAYFGAFSPEELAQLYIHCEVPTDGHCRNYYRFTDWDALRSWVLPGTRGRIFQEEDIQSRRLSPRTDTGLAARVYRLGRRRTGTVYWLRNHLWKNSKWRTPHLEQWLRRFDPDVVFLAAGDYGFFYDLAVEVADYLEKPLAVAYVDDFFLYNRNENTLSGCLAHRRLLRSARRCMDRAGMVFGICPAMAEAYEALFHVPCHVLHTAAPLGEAEGEGAFGISYLGNLGYRRERQLIAMGRALRDLRLPDIPAYIDVYSAERDPAVLKELTPENGIRFHGAVSPEQAARIQRGSLAVIHTESFDRDMRRLTRFSVSTKIPDCLKNGPCIIAYGPEGIASMDYLRENRAAYLITDPADLAPGLGKILTDAALRREIVANARRLAGANHKGSRNAAQLRQWLEGLREEWDRMEP